MSAQIISLKGCTDFRDPAEFWRQRLFAFELRRRDTHLGLGAKILVTLLEAHSGLGSHMDDARDVNLKGQGPTPPNTYKLVMREEPFHGVRAIRLVPVGDGKMFGRDGLLAHSYMLGPNGQSNGCVSFSDYPDFLDAYLKGEVDRLVVVEHLATAPGPKTASLGGTPTRAQTAQRKTFVLVHGAWHGGWCWRRVSDLLEQQGHKVFTPTLTGVGERSHLMSKDINLVGASASTATGTWDNRRRPDCMAEDAVSCELISAPK